jgi:hypothetical protein
MSADPVELSHDLLRAVKLGEPTTDLERALRDLDAGVLDAATTEDGAALAFWLNVYNAVTQLELARNPDRYDKHRFFRREVVPVAGRRLRLDDVEHGILRRSYHRWGLGYVPWPTRSAFVRRMQPSERDPRIHFALNCGAASCPPIAAYTAGSIDEELDLATASYLESEVAYDPATDTVTVPRTLLWFRGDFGGKRGIRELLREFDCIPPDATPSLAYDDYDWTLDRGNFGEGGEA